MNSRSQNTIYNSLTGIILQIITALLAMVYRTALIKVLGIDYLGINGLFSNILNLLSLTELGFNIAIVYRMYEPAKNGDKERLAALLNYFEKIYKSVALIVMVLGLLIMPFLNLFIKNSADIPADINIYWIYFVMLLQSASSYLFTSRQILIQAAQKEYYNNIFLIISTVAKYILQIIVLFIFQNYFILLIVGIFAGVIFNVFYYYFISIKYKEVFKYRVTISEKEKREIFYETKALLMHKVGSVVLNSTDNIVISYVVGLRAVGLYSNYAVVVSMISTIILKIFGGATASIGNLAISETKEKIHKTFLSLSLLSMWSVTYCSVCLFCTLNPFITLWLGSKYTFDTVEVWVISLMFYVMYSRYINSTFINACGIYHFDKYRPLIEAFVNLLFSVILAKIVGISGVFVGTIFSELLTVWWREPYLLYKYIFKIKSDKYWKLTSFFFVYIICMSFICFYICQIFPINWLFLFARIAICTAIVNIPIYILYRNREEFSMIRILINKIIGKS